MYVSIEYSSVGSIIALYTFHFVVTEIPCCDHTLQRLSLDTVVNFHINGVVRCNSAAQVYEVLNCF